MFQQHLGLSPIRRRLASSLRWPLRPPAALLILLFVMCASACHESDDTGVEPAPLDLPTRDRRLHPPGLNSSRCSQRP
jgi:hypothetical protein